jgi:ribosomal protein S21
LLEIKRKENESSDRLLRRFNRSIQQSGLLSVVKKKRFHEKPISKSTQRKSAVRKAIIRENRRIKKEGY